MRRNIKVRDISKNKWEKAFKDWEIILGKDITEMLRLYISYKEFKKSVTNQKDEKAEFEDFLEWLEYG